MDSPGKSTRVGCHALPQGIFPTQGLNPGLLHCRQTLVSEPPGKHTQSFRTEPLPGTGTQACRRKSSDEKELKKKKQKNPLFMRSPRTTYPERTEDRGVFREDAKSQAYPDRSVSSNQEPIGCTRLIQTDVKSEREKQISCINTYAGNLEKQYR